MMTQSDVVLHRGNSIVQYGHFNNRVYVMTLAHEDIPDIIWFAEDISSKEGYSKIFVKVPESSTELFTRAGYITEATVPLFYNGEETGMFMAKYSDPGRKEVIDTPILEDVLTGAMSHAGKKKTHVLPDGFTLRCAIQEDAGDIAALFHVVFATYPFPISNPDYIRQSMNGHVRYFVIKKGDMLAAVASCEIDVKNRTVEMTDFATDPLFRGHGFAGILLNAMENEMRKEGLILAYTIARSISLPMNSTFASAGYLFGGMLPNNTNISGSMESMNVWYKRL